MSKDPIHIAYGIHVTDPEWDYALYAGVSAASLLKNATGPVVLHILTDESLNEEHRNKFRLLASKYTQTIHFYDADEICRNTINNMSQHLSEFFQQWYGLGCLYRIFLPDVLPQEINRCIYLDCDTIVNLDIRTLWEEKTGTNGLGAVAENESCDGPSEYERIIRDLCKRGIFHNDIRVENMVPFIDYFNSGILLMDLDVIRRREMSMAECTVDFLSSFPDSSYPEQDALNVIFSEEYNKLSERYNTLVDQEIFVKKRQVIEQRIYHYIVRGLRPNLSIPQFKLFFSYFDESPWYDEVFYYSWALKENQILLKTLYAIVGRKRVFYAPLNNRTQLKQVVRIQEEETFIDNESQDSLNTLFKIMEEEKGKSCFIVIDYDYSNMRRLFIEKGFIEFDDFVDGRVFLY